jgi:hypothetical protein
LRDTELGRVYGEREIDKKGNGIGDGPHPMFL